MKKYIIISLILTALILILNINLKTLLNYSDAQWNDALALHQNEMPFSMRPMTVGAIVVLQNFFSVRTSFILHQYALLFLFLVSFAIYLESLSFSRKAVLGGVIILSLSYPVLCLHFIPNFSWDDIWAYIGLTWMAYFFFKDRFLLSAICLAFAVLNRESVLVVLPLFFLYRKEKNISTLQLLLLVSPALLYIVYRGTFFPDFLPGRFTRLLANFGSLGELHQSLFSLFISFGYLWVVGLFFDNKSFSKSIKDGGILSANFHRSALAVGLLGVLIVLLAALARETRLFFVPFLFIIPLGLKNITALWSQIKITSKAKTAALILMVLAFFQTLSIFIFPSFNYLPMIDFHRVLFALHATLIVLVLYYRRSIR